MNACTHTHTCTVKVSLLLSTIFASYIFFLLKITDQYIDVRTFIRSLSYLRSLILYIYSVSTLVFVFSHPTRTRCGSPSVSAHPTEQRLSCPAAEQWLVADQTRAGG